MTISKTTMSFSLDVTITDRLNALTKAKLNRSALVARYIRAGLERDRAAHDAVIGLLQRGPVYECAVVCKCRGSGAVYLSEGAWAPCLRGIGLTAEGEVQLAGAAFASKDKALAFRRAIKARNIYDNAPPPPPPGVSTDPVIAPKGLSVSRRRGFPVAVGGRQEDPDKA